MHVLAPVVIGLALVAIGVPFGSALVIAAMSGCMLMMFMMLMGHGGHGGHGGGHDCGGHAGHREEIAGPDATEGRP
ncbi:MAG: hypothetical protein HYU28_09105 [Actinobacteria bacterium]|nr:hypothetical protein [Actinomycetota bacterium]